MPDALPDATVPNFYRVLDHHCAAEDGNGLLGFSVMPRDTLARVWEERGGHSTS
ncbi:hypothetical protein EXN66_Car019404 [Channa argus]|uniref:Uncharacterized protein n=1 Tax=Channa argus TaxID=215402 RepID=A0A6G1QNR0_CHAAH|nr:hypothetical protein EXN66_Car019404 [Channa argus]